MLDMFFARVRTVRDTFKRFLGYTLGHSPAVVHVLPEERDRRLRPVLLDEGHIHVVHEVDEALQARRSVRLATPLHQTMAGAQIVILRGLLP